MINIKENIKEYGREVMVGGESYLFYNEIGKEKELLDSFNELARNTFGISFKEVGGFYEPHVLVKNGEVCANVSVNQVPFCLNGCSVFYIQIGTVMTKEGFCQKGLSRWLIEYVMEQWKENCDAIFLFANDSVLDFYPKFGFEKKQEFHYCSTVLESKDKGAEKLQMDKEEHIQLALKKYKQGNPFAELYMMENDYIFSFYCMGVLKNSVYYSSKYDVLILSEIEDDKLWCYDIFGTTGADLEDILKEINPEKKKVFLGFTPKKKKGLILEEHKEEDTTLFVYCTNNVPFEWNKKMFPIISHA